MSTLAYDNLPDVQRSVKARPLFAMRLSVRPLQVVGETPVGVRRIGVVFGGVFEGERLSGEVLDGGSDWQILRPDARRPRRPVRESSLADLGRALSQRHADGPVYSVFEVL